MAEQKARPVAPPTFEPHFDAEFVDVDMTRVYFALGALTVTTGALATSTVLLWRKANRTQQSMEAMSEYVSRLVNKTDCGRKAYETFMHDVEPTPDWSEEETHTHEHTHEEEASR